MKNSSKNLILGLLLLGVAILSPFVVARYNLWPDALTVNAHSPEENINRTNTTTSIDPETKSNSSNNTNVSSDQNISTQANTQNIRFSFADAVEKAAPSVVSIHTKKAIKLEVHPLYQDPYFKQYFYNPNSPTETITQELPGLGSGVIIDKEGYILTNNHVIQDADEIEVRLNDGRKIAAKIVGADRESDLAVLKINAANLPYIKIGDSNHLRVGDIAIAIGYPFGVGHTVTQGIISATQRNHLGINIFDSFIQTDASINPGNSGGALINIDGELIGINTAILSKSGGNNGIGFAIPIHLAQEVMEGLMKNGHIKRGWLGVSLRKLTPEIAHSLQSSQNEGALIETMVRGGPAHLSGLEPLDIILSINNKPIKEADDVLRTISNLTPNTTYPISIMRKGHIFEFTVTIGERGKEKQKLG